MTRCNSEKIDRAVLNFRAAKVNFWSLLNALVWIFHIVRTIFFSNSVSLERTGLIIKILEYFILQRLYKIIFDLPTWYLLKVMPTFLAKAHNKSAVWPQAAFISAHSTGTCGNRPGISKTKQLMCARHYRSQTQVPLQSVLLSNLLNGGSECLPKNLPKNLANFGPLLKKLHNRTDANINNTYSEQ